MLKCPVCNKIIPTGNRCPSCYFDIAMRSTDVIEKYRQKWLGTLTDFEFDTSFSVLEKYKGTSMLVEVPYGVRTIAKAFYNNHTIRKVSLPESVKTIGEYAFYGCKNLEFIDLPQSLTSIEWAAFQFCEKLHISIPQNVTQIAESSLMRVKDLLVQEGNTHFRIENGMLIDTKRGVLLAEFLKSSYMDIVIPQDVKRIGYMAFCGSAIQNSITLPRGLSSIGAKALVTNTRRPIFVPNTVTQIGSGAFASTNRIILEEGNPNYTIKKNLIIENSSNKVITVCDRSVTSLIIPSDVKIIGEYAIAYCQNLRSVSMPRTVEHIESTAFQNCVRLESVVIPKGVKRTGWGVFNGCSSLKTILCESEEVLKSEEVCKKYNLATLNCGCNARVVKKEAYDDPYQAYNHLSFDGMSGHDFEHFCANILRRNSFSEVVVTKGSGDQGVDIVAKKDGVKYAVQCKHYSTPLGNTSVQEVNAGKIYYKCHVAVVMTNSTFTTGAKALADATGVLLWDRAVLTKMIDNAY